MQRKVERSGGGLERACEAEKDEGRRAGGGGEGSILSESASWSAVSIGDGGREDEVTGDISIGLSTSECERECVGERDGQRRRGAEGICEFDKWSWRGRVSVLVWSTRAEPPITELARDIMSLLYSVFDSDRVCSDSSDSRRCESGLRVVLDDEDLSIHSHTKSYSQDTTLDEITSLHLHSVAVHYM